MGTGNSSWAAFNTCCIVIILLLKITFYLWIRSQFRKLEAKARDVLELANRNAKLTDKKEDEMYEVKTAVEHKIEEVHKVAQEAAAVTKEVKQMLPTIQAMSDSSSETAKIPTLPDG